MTPEHGDGPAGRVRTGGDVKEPSTDLIGLEELYKIESDTVER